MIVAEKSVWAKYSMDLNCQPQGNKAVPCHSALSKDFHHPSKAEMEVKHQQAGNSKPAFNDFHEYWKTVSASICFLRAA